MTTQRTAVTQYVTVGGSKFAYRQIGIGLGIPLVMLMHFRGNMDFWDPALIDALARSRPILMLDYSGVGKSEGEVPSSFQGWAANVIAVVDALKIRKIDLLGFSMGGGAAQHVVLAAPGLVRKLILAGTRTSRTPNTLYGPKHIFTTLATSGTEEEFKAALALSFFNPDKAGQDAAKAYLERIYSRAYDRAPHLTPELARRQASSFAKFSVAHPDNPYERIREFSMPVFVANGDNDLLIPTENSIELARILPHAHLHIYPNSGHGFLFQYAEMFAGHVDLFLDSEAEQRGVWSKM